MKKFIANSSAKASKIFLLFGFIIIFPFMILGMNNYAGYNNDGIIYKSYFSVNAVTTQYSEIQKVNRYFHRDDNNQISSMSYEITLKNGEVLDVLFGDRINQTYEIHKILLVQRPDLFTTGVNEPLADIQKYLNHDSDEIEKVCFIFGIET